MASIANRIPRRPAGASFPPYELLDQRVRAAEGKTRKLERLYHQTGAQAWDPRQVLDELERKHGGIHLSDDKKEALGHLFTVILWGELAAWNIAADLARWLPDTNAKMAATGQVFDEARHFAVLRDYMDRAGVELPPVNPYGLRVLTNILDAESMVQKLYGMQLLVENLALAIFKQVAESRVEPVLTELLDYIERDESRHVALGVLYLPKLLAQSSRAERARNWAFNIKLFLLTIGGGQWLDPHFKTLGVDHRKLGLASFRLHQRILREMAEAEGLEAGENVPGVHGLNAKQHRALVDFLHPEDPDRMSPRHRRALGLLNRAVHAGARLMS